MNDLLKTSETEIKDEWVCPRCDNPTLEIKAWVDLNTKKYVSDSEEDACWCNTCMDHIPNRDIDW